ncbi:hypothetical protein SSP24_51870 [Streptomyces spinoverrucosus]|uniref:Uncharacterized protein n=1 Tax=Streptomyces spinoverrucosus TaxID=284043 RepID=A0A4Y3VKH6_9ACTN|nr:hypothetical protein SSP24_51870 [Streptomyces spinoverrucosus]GHB63616.1 hypothetical protein GCM10010397_37120 [Streptomyces spinoverrucosus]
MIPGVEFGMDHLPTTEAAAPPHDDVPDFLVVPLPGDRTHKEFILLITLTPWLSRHVR